MKKEKVNLLDVVPYVAEHIRTEKVEGLSVIAFPRFKNRFMQKYLIPKGMTSFLHVTLEEHGTAVWDLIDGKRTVSDIIEALAEHFQHEENYGQRITAYITQLRLSGFIKYRYALSD
jgi:hypothetical protein bfra3_02023